MVALRPGHHATRDKSHQHINHGLSTRSEWGSTKHLGLRIWGRGACARFFFGDVMTFLLIFFFWEIMPKYTNTLHLNRDRDSVSSSTDNMKHLGPIPSRWRIPAPCMYPRRAAASSCMENTSLSMKPATLNLLYLIIITAGICKESTFSVGSHSSNLKPHAFSSTRFCRLQSLRCFHTITAVRLLDLVA